MHISVDLSCYPLADDYIPMIRNFINKINQHPDINVVTNTMSTQLFGEFSILMPLLTEAMDSSWAEDGKAIFVCKFINADLTPDEL